MADEGRRRHEEDIRQRQALQAKFSSAIAEVSEKMDAQAAERGRQLAENEELRGKLGGFLEQFESFNTLVGGGGGGRGRERGKAGWVGGGGGVIRGGGMPEATRVRRHVRIRTSHMEHYGTFVIPYHV